MLYREMGQLLLEPLDSNQQFYILSLSAEIKALNLLPAAEELLLSIPLEAGELSQEEKLDRMTRIERILFDR